MKNISRSKLEKEFDIDLMSQKELYWVDSVLGCDFNVVTSLGINPSKITRPEYGHHRSVIIKRGTSKYRLWGFLSEEALNKFSNDYNHKVLPR